MKKYLKKIVAIFCSSVLLIFPALVSASSAFDNLQNVGEKGATPPYAPAAEYKLSEIVGIVIQAFLGLLGVLFLTYMLYAGYSWMTAQGDEEKVTKAKDTIQRAIIGLVVTIGAYAISFWVFDKLLYSATTPILR
jgi:hypothetical protein